MAEDAPKQPAKYLRADHDARCSKGIHPRDDAETSGQNGWYTDSTRCIRLDPRRANTPSSWGRPNASRPLTICLTIFYQFFSQAFYQMSLPSFTVSVPCSSRALTGKVRPQFPQRRLPAVSDVARFLHTLPRRCRSTYCRNRIGERSHAFLACIYCRRAESFRSSRRKSIRELPWRNRCTQVLFCTCRV